MSPYALPMLAASNLAKGVIDSIALIVIFGLAWLVFRGAGPLAERRKRRKR